MLQVLTFIGVAALVSFEALKFLLAARQLRINRRIEAAVDGIRKGNAAASVKSETINISKKANK